MGLAVGDTHLTRGRPETYPFRLPLSVRERVAFARAGLKVQRAVARYHREAKARPGEEPEELRARVLAYEGHRTFKDLLGDLPPAVERIFACAAHRATAELDELSAGCGIGLFALVCGGKGSLIARNLVGGTGRLPAALGERLGGRARTSAPVTAIDDDGDELVVTYGQHAPQRIRASHVVVAAPAPHAAPLVDRVAPQAAQALRELTYGPFLSVALRTHETGPVPWDGVYAMATPGRVFDMFTNQGQALRTTAARQHGGSLMLFAGGRGAAELLQEDDATIVARFLEDLHNLHPQARGIVGDAKVHRWELGNVYARPGRAGLQAPLEGALGARGNVHLAGDYFAELGTMEAAAKTGAAAAERGESLLRHATPEVHHA
jgi:protoporphyrinogen/coproporphyrinogen III oxidase